MTTLLTSAARRSRYLFDWSAAACLAAAEQSLNAQTGQVATFSRASIKTVYDVNGVVRVVPHSLPAFQWATDPVSGLSVPGLLLESGETNLCLQSETFGTTWATSNAAVGSNAFTAPNNALTADAIISSAIDGGVNQSFAKAASALPYTFSVFLYAGGLNTASLWLGTTNAFANGAKATFNLTLGTVSVAAATIGAGWTSASARITALGSTGWYRCQMTATSDAAATLAVAITTPTSGAGVSGFYAWGADLKQAVVASSYIATTTIAVARTTDVLSFAIGFPEIAFTAYAKMVDLGTQITSNNGLFAVGDGSVMPYAGIYSNGAQVGASFHNGTAQVNAGGTGSAIAFADTVEARLVFTTSGTVQPSIARNGGGEVSGAASVGQALGTGWGASKLIVNSYALASANVTGKGAFQSIRVAVGAQSLATMRQG